MLILKVPVMAPFNFVEKSSTCIVIVFEKQESEYEQLIGRRDDYVE